MSNHALYHYRKRDNLSMRQAVMTQARMLELNGFRQGYIHRSLTNTFSKHDSDLNMLSGGLNHAFAETARTLVASSFTQG